MTDHNGLFEIFFDSLRSEEREIDAVERFLTPEGRLGTLLEVQRLVAEQRQV